MPVSRERERKVNKRKGPEVQILEIKPQCVYALHQKFPNDKWPVKKCFASSSFFND